MGWRDINMNRRRPQPRVAFVPMEPGLARQDAVLRKAAGGAVQLLMAQVENVDIDAKARAFLIGYLLGVAVWRARADGVECDAEGDEGATAALIRELTGQLPDWLSAHTVFIRFATRENGIGVRTCRYPVVDGHRSLAEAGYLTGHLEAMAGTERLAGQALARLTSREASSAAAFLTDCDIAADPMQTRQPTMSLRFSQQERTVIEEAFQTLGDP